MKLTPVLIITIGLGPLWWPIDILSNVQWNTMSPTKLAHTSAQLDILMKSTQQSKKSQSSRFYEYINELNELKNQPDSQLLLEILDESYELDSTDQEEQEIELLLLAKCTLAEAHIIFSAVLSLTGNIDLALLYWKGKFKKQQEKPFLDHIQTLPTQWKTQQEIQEKIDTLDTIQSINNTYIGQLATFITNVQMLTNKTALRKLLSEHAQGAGTFLENQKDTSSSSVLNNKELNRQLTSNVNKVDAYQKNMDTSNRDLAEPGHLAKNWLWYVSGSLGALGIGSYIHKKRNERNENGNTPLDRAKNALNRGYTSWWRNPIQRIKELLTGGRRPPLIDPDILERDLQNFSASFDQLVRDELRELEPGHSFIDPTRVHHGIVLPNEIESWDDLIDGDYNTWQDPEGLKTTILDRVANADSLNDKEKNNTRQFVNKVFDWKSRHARGDASLVSEIQTDLGANPLSNVLQGRLPQVYNTQFQSLKSRLEGLIANISNQMNDMELTMKMLALLPASLVVYTLYKIGKSAHDKSHSKEPMYKIMRHITREIGKILNKNNTYIKTSPSYEDQGYLIFWINKLKDYAKELSGDEEEDFKEDLNELEGEEYEVGQKLQTLQRMYNTYGFLRASK